MPDIRYRVYLGVLGEALFFFGLVGWVYGVLIQVSRPEWLGLGLSRLVPWIRVDTFAVLSFLTSILGFLIWRLMMHTDNPTRTDSRKE